ncbi:MULTISPECIES: protein tyrosine phosphatase [unclassified Legionella]|uniref:protein tyrosine phosphatase n=1 Tax=unclassified Legionella TaxID=2622702 RepID=UPI0010552001|nr:MULTISPECIES: protein tyrosine phosphatase [unclassified Legionella]MDI9819727.1 protein tyrosine phosphatase [Legionella sp. PL877]
MNYLVCLLLILINSLVYAENYPVKLGTTQVIILKQAGRGKTFIHLHQNETTALQAAKTYINREGGTLITLKHTGERNIVFYLKHVRYEFDPNRIFTDVGIKKTLSQFGPYSAAAHRETKKLANKIISLLPEGKIIAVHNNKDYSLKNYFPHHSLAADVKALNYSPHINYRNFYFVTHEEEFKRLKKLKFNVALQASKATDDGSLSFYLGKKNYINIEAAYSALKQQLTMIDNA